MYDHTFLNLQITRSDIKPHIKWAVSLVISYGYFNLPQDLCGYVWVNILTLSPLRVKIYIKIEERERQNNAELTRYIIILMAK